MNISYICNPDNTSLEIIDEYLNSELLCIDTFNKISCLFNNFNLKYKTLKLCNFFYNQSLPKTVSMNIPRETVEVSFVGSAYSGDAFLDGAQTTGVDAFTTGIFDILPSVVNVIIILTVDSVAGQ